MASYVSQYSHWHKLVNPGSSYGLVHHWRETLDLALLLQQCSEEEYIFRCVRESHHHCQQNAFSKGKILQQRRLLRGHRYHCSKQEKTEDDIWHLILDELRQRCGYWLVSWVLLSSVKIWLVRSELNSHSSGTAYIKNPNLCGPLLRGFTLSERTSFVGWQHRAAALFYDHLEKHQQNPEVMQQRRKLLIDHVIQHVLDLRSAGLQH